MEIVSPAGSPEGLAASIKGGCDAVYLGGKAFSARAFSDNFTDRELEGAVGYAHDRGVKVYVAVNTLIKDSEMSDAVSYVSFLRDVGADAVIVQDLGLLSAIRRIDIRKHASTQMGVHTREGLEWCADNGLDRAVLARELTFGELERILDGSPVEAEVFVQGALCYSLSGGCLFSSAMGGRSGNRGQCAQPCRKRYSMADRSGYIVSGADIYGADWLGRLEGIGVAAAKIEGRMRSPAYAYLSARVYSTANAGSIDEEALGLLKTVFNRGFCEGYLPGVESPVRFNHADNRGFFLGRAEVRDRRLDAGSLCEPIGAGEGISLFRGDEKSGGFKVADPSRPVAPFGIADGEYDVYRTYDPRIDEVKNLVGPAPKLTGSSKRAPSKHRPPECVRAPNGRCDLSFYISGMKALGEVLGYADRVYFDAGPRLEEAREACEAAGVEMVAHLPRFSPEILRMGGAVMANTVGQVEEGHDGRVYGSHHMNAFNSDFPRGLLYQATLSPELSKAEMEHLAGHFPGRIEALAFGRIEVMCTRDPGMAAGSMADEAGREFPVYRDSFGLSHFLNSSDLLLLPYLRELKAMGIDSIGVDLRRRPPELARVVAKAYAAEDVSKKGRITEMCGAINYGAYLKGIS
ncbi:MAG: U32 family peptidase [Candidatus Methanoplasma sp.]|nr:U32 family peptidase [Candidatus Methanoplasma sp.]